MDKSSVPDHVEKQEVPAQKQLDSPPTEIEENRERRDFLFDAKRSAALNRRLDKRLLPLLCWTNMTSNGYAVTVSLFSVAYAVFEVPSNWVMKHYVRPSLWLAFLLFAWGCLTIGTAGVQNYATVVSLRFLVGVAEAGFFPGIVYLITIWYPHNQRAFRIAMVVAFCNLAGAFGGSIAFGIGHANGAGGLEGFRWLFIIEGIITVISAVPLWLCLPDYPARAKWLNEDDKRFAEDRLRERGGGYNRDHATRKELIETFGSPRMLAHYLAYVADVVPQGSFTFFTPTIVTGLGYQSVQAQLLTVPPWAVASWSPFPCLTRQITSTLADGTLPLPQR
ncbi:putative transporter [Cyphellophora attinorum]|uniref:Putative transporter n=1 Tax=Cyphellophora attinorum TaxID=1664694 RepID=A0A0N0NRP9_9EURO|nr:putative transporter [Phialophora attinorum]KPI45351.1 putative transporter [Phialophora attinorum]